MIPPARADVRRLPAHVDSRSCGGHVSRSRPRDGPVPGPGVHRDPGGQREGGPTTLVDGSARAIQGRSGPARPAGPGPAPPSARPGGGGPGPGIDREGAGRQGTAFPQESAPDFSTATSLVIAGSLNMRGRAAAPVRLAPGLLVAAAAPAGVAPHLAPYRRAVPAGLAGDRRAGKPAFPGRGSGSVLRRSGGDGPRA